MTGERGIALMTALVLSLGATVLSGTLFLVAFLDAAAASNVAASERAFHAAEAGLEHTLASLSPAPDLAVAASWPGGVPPFGAVVDFPSAPVSYRVTSTTTADQVIVVATGTAERGTLRRLEGRICRERSFLTPAALVLGEHFAPGVIAGSVAAVGADRDGLVAGQPTLAVDDEATVAGARGLGSEPRLLPLGSGFAGALTELRATADAVVTGPFVHVVFGTAAAPQVTHVLSSAEFAGSSVATGILVVDGPLRIAGTLAVSGLLIATGDLEVAGSLAVSGGMFLDGRIDVAPGAAFTVELASETLRLAGELRTAVLPRAAFLCGWREVW